MIGVATITLTTVLTAPHSGADPVAVTATVLRIVDGDTADIVDDVRGRLLSLIHISEPTRQVR